MDEDKKELTLGSLFDGSGGFPLGGIIAGIKPLWASEIEPYPIRVTTKRIPEMKHLGDVSKINGAEIEPVDIITFGSPCQDMSIAGKRQGLEGSRSNLFYEAIRIIKEMREATNGKQPRYAVWENVPGAFSSNGGEDFRAVLESLCSVCQAGISIPQSDQWSSAGEILGNNFSLAWRVLDAQYWGVPQRRKRIYLVADFRGRSAGKILFESEGLSGYSAEGFRAWQRVARSAANGTGNAGICLNNHGGQRMDMTEEVTDTLRAEAHHPPCVMALENYPADSRITVSEDDKAQMLTSRMGTGGDNVPLVMDTPKTLKIRSGCEGGGKGALVQEDKSATLSCSNDQTVFVPQAYGIGAYNSEGMKSDNPHSGIYEADTSRTLDCSGGMPSANQGGIAVVESYAIQGNMIGQDDKNEPQRVYKEDEKQKSNYTIRKLTPRECARLQGFPDWWCDDLGIEEKDITDEELDFWENVWETYRLAINNSNKKKSRNQIKKWLKHPESDSAEYKMWGNGIALPCVYFVLSGIVYYSQQPEEKSSRKTRYKNIFG